MRRIALSLSALVLLLAVSSARADLEGIPYTVVSGDTASGIAARYGIDLDVLRSWNAEVDLDHLRVGQRLIVGRGRSVTHRVSRGDTLTALAERYGVTIPEIVRWNEGLRPDRLLVGHQLSIFARRDEPRSHSIGEVDRGSLEHGMRIEPHEGYTVRDRDRAWISRHVMPALRAAFDAVRERHPDAPRVEIRDASLEHGGRMRDHHSHQSGRDIDIAYYRTHCGGGLCRLAWLRPMHLDAGAQWALLENWLRQGVVEYVFIDRSLQEPLYREARARGATRSELSHWFQYPRGEEQRYGAIRHVDGHRNHLHVRFACDPRDDQCIPSDGSAGN